MARSASFGDILRDARIRQGLDVNSVARHLRIRPDIVMAIENCDFAAMPPRGYSKSMINSYARLLGLNSAKLVKVYQDELYAFEIGRVRTQSTTRHERNARTQSGVQRGSRSARSSRQSHDSQFQDDRRTSRSRSSSESRMTSNAGGRMHIGLNDGPSGGRTYNPSRVHTSRNVSLPNSQYTNLVAAPKNVSRSGGSGSKLPFIAIGLVLLLILVIVLFVFNGKDDNATEDLPDVPVSGLTDTSTPVDNTANNVPTPPTDAEFEFEIIEGEEAYYEIYVDGAEKPSKAGTVAGPVSERYDVSGKLRFVTARPSAVNVSVNGEPVTLTDEDGNGVYEYTVDFSQILAQWQADNQAAIDAANAANATTQDDASTQEDAPAE